MDENEVVVPGADDAVVDAPETEEEVAPEAAPETGDEEAAA